MKRLYQFLHAILRPTRHLTQHLTARAPVPPVTPVTPLTPVTAVTALIAITACSGAPAHAGAWPREKGTGFLSVATYVSGTSINGPYALYTSTYGEYGLGRNLTLGVDIGHGVSGKSKAIVFLRAPLGARSSDHLFAAELGFGQIAGEMVLRPGLSYGHGFSRKNGRSGWISIEAVSEHRLTTSQVDYKADFTFGLTHSDRFKTILQLQTGKSHRDPFFARLAPSG